MPDRELLPLDLLDRALPLDRARLLPPDRRLLPLDRELLAVLDPELPDRWLAADFRAPDERELPVERGLLADFELLALRELPEAFEALPEDFDALAVLLLDPLALCERACVGFCLRCVALAGLDDERVDVLPRLPEPR